MKQKGGKDKNMTTTTPQCKDPSNHNNHCNINGHTDEKCWKLHLQLKLKNKKKNIMATNSRNQVQRILDMDENRICTSMQKEVNLSSFQQHEEKQMTKIFHIKIQSRKQRLMLYLTHDRR